MWEVKFKLRRRAACAVFGALGLLLALAPTAGADPECDLTDPVGCVTETVEETTQTVDDIVEDTEKTVDKTVAEVEKTAEDAADAVDEAVEDVVDPVARPRNGDPTGTRRRPAGTSSGAHPRSDRDAPRPEGTAGPDAGRLTAGQRVKGLRVERAPAALSSARADELVALDQAPVVAVPAIARVRPPLDAGETAKRFAFPLIISFLVIVFILVQDRFDRSDAKLSLSRLDPDSDALSFR